MWSGRNISTFQSGCSSVFWNVCEFFRGENLLRMNNVCRVVVEVRFWNWLQLITDLIFTKCMFLFFLRGGGREAKSKNIWPRTKCQWGESIKSIMGRLYKGSTTPKWVTPSIIQPMKFCHFKWNQSKLKLCSICMNVGNREFRSRMRNRFENTVTIRKGTIGLFLRLCFVTFA